MIFYRLIILKIYYLTKRLKQNKLIKEVNSIVTTIQRLDLTAYQQLYGMRELCKTEKIINLTTAITLRLLILLCYELIHYILKI